MADDARQSLPDLDRPAMLSESFDFFELLRRLERSGRLFGHSGRPDREPARLGQHIRLGFRRAGRGRVPRCRTARRRRG